MATEHSYGVSTADFGHGDRVASHPITDAFMMGDRFGTVDSTSAGLVYVLMDRSGRVVRFAPCDLRLMNEKD